MFSIWKYLKMQVILVFPSEGNFYATSSRGRYGNASSVTGYLKHD